ncbi:MAG: hypothetical protein N2203_08080 [Bacteroidia bacterium]|nr:hypothetical protein [Bacteroidia bacterium]
MRKALLGVIIAVSFAAKANIDTKYQVDENKLNAIVMQAIEMTENELDEYLNCSIGKMNVLVPEQTRGGYLLRAFFCGGIALHRYYMGTSNQWMWAMYFCIPVVGEVTACVDFWGAVFDKDFYLKYKNNDKYIVWLD